MTAQDISNRGWDYRRRPPDVVSVHNTLTVVVSNNSWTPDTERLVDETREFGDLEAYDRFRKHIRPKEKVENL